MGDQVHPGSPSIPPPATYAKPRHRGCRGRLAGCCCCLLSIFCTLLFGFLVLAGITILVLWLVLKPIHLPKYSLDNVDFCSFSVGQNNNVNADILYTITANNPKKKIGIKYDNINIESEYDGQVFGHSTAPGFYQGHQNVTTITSEVLVNNYALTSTSATTLASQI
ncbi:NDR1/HIN1-like protein 10 [Physcomitrium patens]|uniref:Late embryogenesis abundant protein LEA-2 subgroup domain-containing protein n=1 Tax=Physcomitrium patens TaxID=3218 RepID=A9SF33_PHYPA|nr:NDR1/HIN1-like protein 2 [Physcomitrium patens]|eukprot:XP_024376769.1 NDR1/HIN1-like protein 2 [Physcomitrella patens]